MTASSSRSLIAWLLLSLAAVTLPAQAVESCAEQRARIEARIAQEKALGNDWLLKGLEMSLERVNDFCDDRREQRRAAQELEDQQRRFARAQAQLDDAKAALTSETATPQSAAWRKKQQRVDELERALETRRQALEKAEDDDRRLNGAH